jgi:anti-anti-sigma factor
MDNAFLQEVNANRTDPVLFIHGANGQVLAASVGDNPGLSAEQQINQQLWRRAVGGEIVESREIASDGTPRRVMHIPLTPGKQSQLVYSIALTTAEIQAFRLQTINRSVIALGIVGLIAFGVLFYFIRQFIARPLSSLSATAAQLGAGNLDVRLVATGRDEIGRLTASFDAMVQQLRRSFSALDQRNLALQQEIAERKRTEEARAQLQEEVMLAHATIMEMSTPLIPIDGQTVVMPLVGTLDSRRAQQVFDTLLRGIEASNVRVAILDITGIPLIDTQVAGVLIRAAQAVRLLGARVVLTGIRPEVAQSLVGLGVDLRELSTYSTLESAIASTTH